MEEKNFNLFYDRKDPNYLQELTGLLSPEELKKNAITDKDDKNPIITIKFSGLSAMTLLGGDEDPKNNPVFHAFKNLISDKNQVVTNLNKEGYAVQIKLLFAYPYSDFFYDIVQAEITNNKGVGISCIINKNPIEKQDNVIRMIDYANIKESPTFRSLKRSLYRLYKNKADVFTNKAEIAGNKSRNKLAVKFTPINGLCCILQINNTIYLDSYLYAKKEYDSQELSLISPIVRINATKIGDISKLSKAEQEAKHKELNQQHYYSILCHFRYFWNHTLTLYNSDVCYWHYGIIEIFQPHAISYMHKATRLINKANTSESDMWRQRTKDEFLRYTSKFTEKDKHVEKYITCFIAGAWEAAGVVNDYMEKVEEYIEDKFQNNKFGLRIKPQILRIQNGENLQSRLYTDMENAKVGIVVQTKDHMINLDHWRSKPNVYVEKGYLIRHLDRFIDYRKKEKFRVFVFCEKGVEVESDNSGTGTADFLDMNDFEYQMYKVVYHFWDITELNTRYSALLLQEERERLKHISENGNCDRDTIKRLKSYIKDISNKLEEMQTFMEEREIM